MDHSNKYRYYVGIDPGSTGGIAVIDTKEGTLTLYDLPKIGNLLDARGILEIYEKYTQDSHLFAIEDVHAIANVSAHTNFVFGHALGLKEGLLYAAKASFLKVAPKKWQSICWQGVPVQQKNGKNNTKATSLIAATRLFPNQKFLKSKDGQIDAALIAKYLEITT